MGRVIAANRAERGLLLLFLLVAFWGCGGSGDAADSGEPSGAAGEGIPGGEVASVEVETPPVQTEGAAQPIPDTGEAAAEVMEAGVEAGAEDDLPPRQLPTIKLKRGPDRTPAPEVTLTDLSGRSIELKDLRGNVVVINFWATWCPPCKREIPHLAHLQESYREAGLKVLGLSLDQKGLAAVKPFVRGRREINYTIIPNGHRAAAEFGRLFGRINSIPMTFLLDREGRVIEKFRGLPDPVVFEGYVLAAIRE